MKRSILFGLVLMIVAQINAQQSFYAYHTKQSHTATDYFGKYADLVVVLDGDRQLEFTRRNQYRPEWITPNGRFMVDDFYTDRDKDSYLEYSYVRLLEERPDRIIVHWRHIPYLEKIEESNEALNPTAIEGFTSVVHEIFTIYPDGKVEREVKDANGSRYESWLSEDYGHRQVLMLLENGIEHGRVTWGKRGVQPIGKVAGNPVIKPRGLPSPVLAWKFDDWLTVSDEEYFEEFAYESVESVTGEFSPILGHSALYKSGVSGSALGFDEYYTGIIFEDGLTESYRELSIEAWIALDVYPFNEAPVLHQSSGFGNKGFYLGVDAYGKLLLRVNNQEVQSDATLDLYQWTHVSASLDNGMATLFLNGTKAGSFSYAGNPIVPDTPLYIGINNEKRRPTDYVRGYDQNIPFIYGIQGMMDEIKVYDQAFSAEQVKKHYNRFKPEDITSPLSKAVLPGENGIADSFGATYKNLEYHELWDRMWRLSEGTDIVVKFDDNPASVVYWRGTNFAANWVADNNRWMADQSSEIFTKHGCSEHMSDKQTRHSYARIIENNAARVIIHWRYPCVDVGYICIDRMNYTDEYHTIYPDGTGIRKVVYNNSTTEAPGFLDIQFFTNPGEKALDVVPLNAVTVANIYGETQDLVWEKPNKIPQTELRDATIQFLNTKSNWQIYAIYPEPGIWTWGRDEQSEYTDDPFAGPWNHWPVSIVPSDGRFATDTDRVTHFAVGAGDAGEDAIVHYGFTNQGVSSLFNRARYWQNPPKIIDVQGGVGSGFNRAEKAFFLKSDGSSHIGFSLNATADSPVVNPAIVIKGLKKVPTNLRVNGKVIPEGKNLRMDVEQDTNGDAQVVIWIKVESVTPLRIEF